MLFIISVILLEWTKFCSCTILYLHCIFLEARPRHLVVSCPLLVSPMTEGLNVPLNITFCCLCLLLILYDDPKVSQLTLLISSISCVAIVLAVKDGGNSFYFRLFISSPLLDTCSNLRYKIRMVAMIIR
ncbi:hypothetical protein Droror1_Dr00014388 [Drosera rotundifolia]